MFVEIISNGRIFFFANDKRSIHGYWKNEIFESIFYEKPYFVIFIVDYIFDVLQ